MAETLAEKMADPLVVWSAVLMVVGTVAQLVALKAAVLEIQTVAWKVVRLVEH